jgi:hypothetical protein
VITAAALCPAPPLLARELTGLDPVVPELREACREAVTALVASAPALIAVVGVGTRTRDWDETAGLDLRAYAPGVPAGIDSGAGEAVPLPLGLGARLLDQAGYAGARLLFSVREDEPPQDCADLGAKLAAADSVALLVMADGGARRGLKAPGYLDERCAPFDADVEAAIRSGDLQALMAVDPVLARELMATGRPAWQVLAGAWRLSRPACTIRYSGDPFGVAYLVASLTAG